MDNDYYSIEAILAENQASLFFYFDDIYKMYSQKIPCTFKVDIPDMGHLAGGSERHVRAYPIHL